MITVCNFREGVCGPRDLTDFLDAAHAVVVSVIYYILSEIEDKLVSLMIMWVVFFPFFFF